MQGVIKVIEKNNAREPNSDGKREHPILNCIFKTDLSNKVTPTEN